MKKHLLSAILLFVIFSFNVNAQQCLSGGCSNFTNQYPTGTFTPSTSWQTHAYMNAGNYTFFNVSCGNTYDWTYCESYGGVSTAWDAQLTLYNNSNLTTPLCFSTDVCGTNGNAPYIRWTANFTGTVRVLTTAYVSGSGCKSNTGAPYNTLAWRQSASGTCCTTVTKGTSPSNQTVTAPASATFGITVQGTGPTYQWQYSINSGSTWSNVPSSSPYSGTTSASLVINPTTTSMSGYEYRCIIGGTCTTAWNTNAVTLTVNQAAAAPSISSVSPSPVTGSASAQIITINGANFVSKPTLTLTWTGQSDYQVPAANVTFVSSTQLKMSITTGINADTWTVKATNPSGQSSNQYTFSVVAPVQNTPILGVDVSSYQGSTINWSQVKTAGYVFAFAKATEGVSITDADFVTNMVNGENAGVKMGAYHFAHPEDNTATAEASHFLSVAGSYIKSCELPPVLDFETTGSLSASTLTTWVQAWMTAVKNATGITPILYSDGSIASSLGSSLKTYPLWMADPDGSYTTPPPASDLGSWTTWAFKQYNWTATVSGINDAGNVDLDVFNGNMTALNTLMGCSSTLAENNTAGIRENFVDNNFAVYPNPSNDKITVEYPAFGNNDEMIEIYNIQGQLLMHMEMLQAKTTIDVSAYTKGMYFVKVKSVNGTKVNKFIKN